MDADPQTKVIELPAGGRRRMSMRARVLFFLVAWAIVLLPLLFWHATWFGRLLSDQEISEYLHDENRPRHIQQALVQIGERIARKDGGVSRWYPDLVRLSTHRSQEIRNTDAWIMGQDNTRPEFHQALLAMLNDRSPTVRANAALALVRFGDTAGKAQILAMLAPMTVVAPAGGRVTETAQAGLPIRQGTALIKTQTSGDGEQEVRAPANGRVRSILVEAGSQVSAGETVAVMDPGEDAVWEALRALYVIGGAEDLAVVRRYERPLPGLPDRVRQQAEMTEKAIVQRAQEPIR